MNLFSALTQAQRKQARFFLAGSGLLWVTTLVLLIVVTYYAWGLVFSPGTTSISAFFEMQEVLPPLLAGLSISILLSGVSAAFFLHHIGAYSLWKKPAQEQSASHQDERSSVSKDVQLLARQQREEKVRRKMEIDRKIKEYGARLDRLPADDRWPERALKLLCRQLEASRGMLYTRASENRLVLKGLFATPYTESTPQEVICGEGLNGEAARQKQPQYFDDVPKHVLPIRSGLGESRPRYLALIPLMDDSEELLGLLELASFRSLRPYDGELTQALCARLSRGLAQLPQDVLGARKPLEIEAEAK